MTLIRKFAMVGVAAVASRSLSRCLSMIHSNCRGRSAT